MKKILRFISLFIATVTVFTAFQFALAKDTGLLQVSATIKNPYFEHLDLQESITAARYYAQPTALTQYSEDKNVWASAIGNALLNHNKNVSVYYIIDGALPTNETALKEKLREITLELFDIAAKETDNPKEGDSLRFSYSSLSYSGGYEIRGSKSYINLDYTINYFTTYAQEQQLTAAVDDLVQSFGFVSSDTEKYKADTIYQYITQNVTYDYENLYDDNYLLKFSAYAALIDKTAVCEGYAVLFYRLAEECGLDARVIAGIGGDGNTENHAWNIVKIGQSYYYLDSTWDAGVQPENYEFYLKGKLDFVNHTNSPQYNTPTFYLNYPIPDYGIITGSSSGTDGYFAYYQSGGTAIITNYLGSEKNITVPSTVNGIPVTQIWSNAFSNNDTVETLTFSEGIRSLSIDSIIDCDSLKTINMPSTMSITNYQNSGMTTAPADCDELETITVAAGNPYIKVIDGILYDADVTTLLYCPPKNGLTQINVPSTVTVIGNSAITDHKTLEKIVLPNSIDFIGYWAFTTSTKLKDINLPEGLEGIGQYAFSNTAVKKIHLPSTLTNLMNNALSYCYPDTITVSAQNPIYRVTDGALIDSETVHKYATSADGEITIPEGIKYIGHDAFAKSTVLKKITLPSTLIKVGQGAFHQCSSINHIELPAGTQTIGAIAFSECNNLVSIIIPETVTQIETVNVFHPNHNVTVYGVKNSNAHSYATTNELIFKPISEFVCTLGHDLQKQMVEDAYFYDIFTYQCTVCGCKTINYTKTYRNISEATGEIEFTEATYTASTISPDVLWVKYGDELLTEGVDYVIMTLPEGSNTEIGMAGVNIEGIGDYVGIKPFNFEIKPASITDAIITVNAQNLCYNGKPLTPEVTVIWNGKKLSLYDDYTVEYLNNNAAGTASVIITGNYRFKDSVTKTFEIGKHQHSFDNWMWTSSKQHKRVCIGYGCNETEYADHRFSNACDDSCEDCGAIRTAPHDFTGQYHSTEYEHWQQCKYCSEGGDRFTHYGGIATCKSGAICGGCQREYTQIGDHEYVNGKCKYCGGAEPIYTPPMQNPFNDISEKNYFYTPVLWAVQNGVTAGISADSFAPSQSCTRGQVVAFLWRAAGCPEPKSTRNPFTDVNPSSYYYKAVLWAVENNITAGMDANHFAPSATCTRGQIVTFLFRFAKSPTVSASNPFTDVSPSSFYYSAVLWAVQNNITAGMDANHFAPSATCTRGQVVSFLYRYVSKN